jgi:hypothetical protein
LLRRLSPRAGTIPNGFAYAGCEITFNPPNQTVGIAGGFLWIDVAVSEPDCPWTVSTTAWAVLKSPAAGAGSFTLALEIERNTGPGRVVTIRVGSAEFLLRQLGVREIRPVHGDFSGDGAADLALFRPSTVGWWIPPVVRNDGRRTVPASRPW